MTISEANKKPQMKHGSNTDAEMSVIQPRIARMTRIRTNFDSLSSSLQIRVSSVASFLFLSCLWWRPQGLAVLFAVLLSTLPASAEDDSAKLFKDSVRPLLERKCFQCHSEKADELKGNLK